MRRTTGLALLTALLAAALPAGAARACSPAIPTIALARDVVVPGGTVAVSGETTDAPFTCDTPTPSPTVQVDVHAEDPEPISPTGPAIVPTVLPTLRKIAYAAPATHPVRFELVPATDFFSETGPSRAVGTAVATASPFPGLQGVTLYRFSARVRIPADVVPGSYRLSASTSNEVFYGYGMVRVVASLPETGAPARDLVTLGGLLVLSGAAALVAGRRRVTA